MFEGLMTKLVKLSKNGEVIGELTTEVFTSHYGQPEWSGCSDDLENSDKIVILDANGGPEWSAVVVGLDEHDGWALILTDECDARYYCIHPNNGWLTCLEPTDVADIKEAEEVVARLNDGTYRLAGTIPLGDGWGCV